MLLKEDTEDGPLQKKIFNEIMDWIVEWIRNWLDFKNEYFKEEQ